MMGNAVLDVEESGDEGLEFLSRFSPEILAQTLV
jgi:hypothetical protein